MYKCGDCSAKKIVKIYLSKNIYLQTYLQNNCLWQLIKVRPRNLNGTKFNGTEFWTNLIQTRTTCFSFLGFLCNKTVRVLFFADNSKLSCPVIGSSEFDCRHGNQYRYLISSPARKMKIGKRYLFQWGILINT